MGNDAGRGLSRRGAGRAPPFVRRGAVSARELGRPPWPCAPQLSPCPLGGLETEGGLAFPSARQTVKRAPEGGRWLEARTCQRPPRPVPRAPAGTPRPVPGHLRTSPNLPAFSVLQVTRVTADNRKPQGLTKALVSCMGRGSYSALKDSGLLRKRNRRVDRWSDRNQHGSKLESLINKEQGILFDE